jgi:hypothetical protein
VKGSEIVLVAATFLSATSCSAPDSPILAGRTPVIYMILSGDPSPATLDSSLYAVVTQSSPVSQYLNADLVELTRRSSPSVFAWQPVAQSSPFVLGINGRVVSDVGNLRLSWRDSAGMMGRQSLVPGDYDLTVSVAGLTIHGFARVPQHPLVTTRDSAGKVAEVQWTRVPGAAYFLYADSDAPSFQITRDTFYRVRWNQNAIRIPDKPMFDLVVVDTSFERYFRDTSSVTIGLDGAHGVFAGISEVLVPLLLTGPKTHKTP